MRLVIQGPGLQPRHLKHLSQLAGGAEFRQTAEHAYCLTGQTAVSPAIRDYCMLQQLDCAWVADGHRLENFGLAVMDMDSTLINIECIDEIADMCGLKPQVAKITESAMLGEIEFAESLQRRVALLKGLEQSALQRVIDERLGLNPGAQAWIDACKRHGIRTMLVSGGFDFFAERVQAMTGLDYIQANSLEIIGGRLSGRLLGPIVDAQAKADHLARIRDHLQLNPEQVIAIGDGANDLKMMAAAGVGIAYHAKPLVQQQASYALNHAGLDGVIPLLQAC